ncbi:lysozyme [Anaerosporobacter faecicola]|uniref:lysozyme n=1 Tax=Anaerosporobacter faecicola TaxID=2718714 RepID=UPI00143A46E7|nr:lysozyme [Anaerosporobacter faecicola]
MMEEPKIIFKTTTSEDDEIMQGLKTLYTTPEGTIPLDRVYGLNQDFIGYPTELAKNMYALEVINKTEVYEPRVEVDVSFEDSEDGKIIPVIKIKKSEEGDEE